MDVREGILGITESAEMMESPASPNLSLDLIANLARIARGLASPADVVERRHEKTPGKRQVSQF